LSHFGVEITVYGRPDFTREIHDHFWGKNWEIKGRMWPASRNSPINYLLLPEVRPHSALGYRPPAPETILPKEELQDYRKAAYTSFQTGPVNAGTSVMHLSSESATTTSGCSLRCRCSAHLAQRAMERVGRFEIFESPSLSISEALRILHHCANHQTRAFGSRVIPMKIWRRRRGLPPAFRHMQSTGR